MKMKKKGGAASEGDERRTETTTKTKKKGDGDEAAAVVLRMELHCEGCALKVRKAIKGAQGAESVRTDVVAGTVTVTGKADPWDLRDRIQARMARHKPVVDIDFVSPANPPRPPPKPKEQEQRRISNNKDDGDTKNRKGNSRRDKGNKQMSPPESTVVLNIQLHCKGCTDRIKRKANKIKGVKQVSVDTGKEQVTVKGTMDAKTLPDVLSAKLKRRVTAVVVPPMTNKDKKAAAADGGGDYHDDNREEGVEAGGTSSTSTSGGGANKKNKNWPKKQQQQQRGEAAAVAGDDHHDEMAPWMSVSKEQQYPTIFPASYGKGGSVGSSYRVELLQGPQPFSDDNPNACSLM